MVAAPVAAFGLTAALPSAAVAITVGIKSIVPEALDVSVQLIDPAARRRPAVWLGEGRDAS